jgi:hypothetical protein
MQGRNQLKRSLSRTAGRAKRSQPGAREPGPFEQRRVVGAPVLAAALEGPPRVHRRPQRSLMSGAGAAARVSACAHRRCQRPTEWIQRLCRSRRSGASRPIMHLPAIRWRLLIRATVQRKKDSCRAQPRHNPGLDEPGHGRCDWSSYRVSASETGAVSRLSGRSSAVCRSGGRGCGWRRGWSATPVTWAYGRSATRRLSRPTGMWRQGAERGVRSVVMVAASTTVGAQR